MATNAAVGLLALVMLARGASTCQSQESTPESEQADERSPAGGWRPASAPGSPGAEGVLVVKRSGQTMLGSDVRVGAGNIWEAEYTPQGGTPTKGLTAMLWFSERGDASKDRRLRVHAGQTFTAAGYNVRVLSVTSENVSLAMTQP